MSPAAPPRVPELIVAAILPDADTREAVLGDLTEDHAAILVQKGPREAARWYWSQLFWSSPRLLQVTAAQMNAASWLSAAGVVLLGYVCLAALVVAAQALLSLVLDSSVALEARAGVSLVVSTLCGVAGGYVAAWIGRRAPIASAVALGAICALLALPSVLSNGDGTPFWYRLGLLLIVLPATTAGGLLRVLWRHRP